MGSRRKPKLKNRKAERRIPKSKAKKIEEARKHLDKDFDEHHKPQKPVFKVTPFTPYSKDKQLGKKPKK